jgi:adenylate cyclase
LSPERLQRRLTAILAADVAGYSRLTGMDEEGTHAQLQDHLRLLVDPKIAEYRGRVVKNTGDGMLAGALFQRPHRPRRALQMLGRHVSRY